MLGQGELDGMASAVPQLSCESVNTAGFCNTHKYMLKNDGFTMWCRDPSLSWPVCAAAQKSLPNLCWEVFQLSSASSLAQPWSQKGLKTFWDKRKEEKDVVQFQVSGIEDLPGLFVRAAGQVWQALSSLCWGAHMTGKESRKRKALPCASCQSCCRLQGPILPNFPSTL